MKHIQTLLTLSILLFGTSSVIGQTDAMIPIRGICIYISYPDAPPEVTPARLNNLLNNVAYTEPNVNRSFRNYWLQETRRNYDITHDIFFYVAPLNSTAYAEGSPNGINYWRDALEWVIANNPSYDWSSLSTFSLSEPADVLKPNVSIGGLRAVTIISSVPQLEGVGAAHAPEWTLSNGAQIESIQGSELREIGETNNELFTLCHEAGHSIFGFPDTYDYESDSGGTYIYTLMSGFGGDFPPVGAPFLASRNWGHVITPPIGTTTYRLRADGDRIVVLRNAHDPNEFFSIEARQQSTAGNSMFPTNLGLVVWHTDLKVNDNTQQNRTRYAHYAYSVEQPDGLFELETGGSNPPVNAGDVFRPGNSFTDSTTPNSKWWAGESSGIEIKDIQYVGTDEIAFTVVVPDLHNEHYPEIPQTYWSVVSAAPGIDGQHSIDKAFDGNSNTYYHTEFPASREVIIDLCSTYEINEFYYTANDNCNAPYEGRIKDYELYISNDGVNWGAPVASERFFQTLFRQYELFTPKVGRYVKFVASNSHEFNELISIAELGFRGQYVGSTISANSAVTLNLTLDNFPAETSWEIRDASNNVVSSGDNYDSPNTTISINTSCLSFGCYSFTILDSEGDGICCDFGTGSYQIVHSVTGAILASGGAFTNSESKNFCVGFTVSATAFLQAAANNGSMTTNLANAGLLPTTDPYTGQKKATPAVLNGMVDWVLVEIRDKTTGTLVLAQTAGLLKPDGSIVESDGTSPLVFDLPHDNYHIAIRHRNHLGVMTATSILLD